MINKFDIYDQSRRVLQCMLWIWKKKRQIDAILSNKYNIFFSNDNYETFETKTLLDKHKNIWHSIIDNYDKLFEFNEKIIRISLYDKIWDRFSNCNWTTTKEREKHFEMNLRWQSAKDNIVLINDATKIILSNSSQNVDIAIENVIVLVNNFLNHLSIFLHDRKIDTYDYEKSFEIKDDFCFEKVLKIYTQNRLSRYKAIVKFSNFSFKLSLKRWWWEKLLRDYVLEWLSKLTIDMKKKIVEQRTIQSRERHKNSERKEKWHDRNFQWLLKLKYEIKKKIEKNFDDWHMKMRTKSKLTFTKNYQRLQSTRYK